MELNIFIFKERKIFIGEKANKFTTYFYLLLFSTHEDKNQITKIMWLTKV